MKQKIKYNKKTALAASWVGLLLFGVTMISVGSFLPFLETKHNLQAIDKGSLATALPVGILIGSVFFGPVVDRYSYKYLLCCSMLLIAIGMELTAFANAFVWVQVAFFLIGIGGGAINGAGSALVADISDDFNESKSSNLSILGTFFGLGALLTPALLALLSDVIGQETFIAAIGVIAFLPAVFYLLITFPESKHPEGLKAAEWLSLLTKPALLLIGMLAFMQSAAESMMNNWTTSYWTGTFASSTKQALFNLTLFTLFFTIGRFALGYLLRKNKPFTMLGLSLATAFAGSFALLFADATVLAVALLGLGLAAGFPVIFGAATELFSKLSGSALSVVLILSLTGNILANHLMGRLGQHYGIGKLPFVVIAIVAMEFLLLYPVVVAYRKQSAAGE